MSLALSPRNRFLSSSATIASIALAIFVACPAQAQSSGATAQNTATFYRQPSVFVENRGQWDGDFLYKTSVGAMSVFVEKHGWTFMLFERKEIPADTKDPIRGVKHPEYEVTRGVAVTMHFVGSTGAQGIVPGARSPGVHHYLLGNDPTRWRTEVPIYESVLLARAWPGVDVGCRIEGEHFEYDVFVSPGADLSRVAIDVKGADALRLDADGSLVIETALGPVRQPAAKTWQVLPDGRREPVACDYLLLGERRLGFSAPHWNRDLPLVIDPGLVYWTFLGSSDARSVAVDASGSATAVGGTIWANFPTTPGAYDTSLNNGDVFVSRLDPTGSALIYSTFLGGSASDWTYAVAVDASGATTVAGYTTSTDFPTTPGAFDSSHNGGAYDVFVTRLNPTGSALIYSTYLGSAAHDYANAVAVDASGAATVGGSADHSNFPTTPGAYDTSHNGAGDGFVAQLSPTGSLLYSTFLGGTGYEYVGAVALDASGAATVAGASGSTDFPTTPGAYDTTYSGGFAHDAFVARLDPTGSALMYSTWLGGTGSDYAYAVALDGSGAATVAGNTTSTNFPTTPGAYDTSANGMADDFVARLSPTGSALLYSTYLGGAANDNAHAVVVDASGAATVGGDTLSPNFPTTPGAHDTSLNGSRDAFVARLNPTGSALVYSTYLGGNLADLVYGAALDATGAVTVAGYETSVGYYNSFVARLQLSTFGYPLMAFPDVQSVPSGAILGLQVAGPAGASVALMFDPVALNIPVPPYGAIGVTIPPAATADGIGLGFPGSVPMPLTIGSQGVLYFSYSPVPASLVGSTLYAQAVALDPSLPPLPPLGGIGLSTHGNLTLPTPACQVTFVP